MKEVIDRMQAAFAVAYPDGGDVHIETVRRVDVDHYVPGEPEYHHLPFDEFVLRCEERLAEDLCDLGYEGGMDGDERAEAFEFLAQYYGGRDALAVCRAIGRAVWYDWKGSL